MATAYMAFTRGIEWGICYVGGWLRLTAGVANRDIFLRINHCCVVILILLTPPSYK